MSALVVMPLADGAANVGDGSDQIEATRIDLGANQLGDWQKVPGQRRNVSVHVA